MELKNMIIVSVDIDMDFIEAIVDAAAFKIFLLFVVVVILMLKTVNFKHWS